MSPEARRSTKRRRLHVISVVAIVALVAVWWTGGFGIWPRRQAMRAIAAGRLDEAESWIRRALLLDRGSAESYFLLARIQRRQGQLREFDESLRRASARGLARQRADKERLLAQAQSGQIEPIQSQLDEFLIRGDSDGREVFEAYVNGCLAAARLDEAALLIDGWERTFPDDPQPNYYRGRLLKHYQQYERAAEQFERALEKRPDHYAAVYLLGQLLLLQNRTQQALVLFQQCDAVRYNAAARIAQAKALRALGRIDEARSLLESVVQLPEEQVRLSFQRVGDRYEGAPAHFELGSLESTAGRYEAALRWLDEAVRANPQDLSARYARGIALRGVGRAEEAAQEFQAVIEARRALREVDRLADLVSSDPTLVEERVRIGELYLTYESKKTGEYWLKTALARDPHHARAHELLARYYQERSGDDAAYTGLAEHHRRLADNSRADGNPANPAGEQRPAPAVP